MSTSISATEIGLPDNVKLKLGTGDDAEIFHNGTDTRIVNTTGDLSVRGGVIKLASTTGEEYFRGTADGSADLFHDNVVKLSTNSDGYRSNDNVKAQFGNSSDLQIFHDGTGCNIRSTSTKLEIRSPELILQNSAAEKYFRGLSDGAAEIYYDNSKKLETISTGLNVTGGVRLGGNNSANELDDYETGSWTPVVGGWDTFSPYSGSSYYAGWYVKVCDLVNVGWKIYIQNLTTVSSNAHIYISGLPFASKAISAGNPAAPVRFDIPEFGFNGYQLTYLSGNSTVLYMYKHINGGNHLVQINATANRSNAWTMGTATYQTD